MHSGMNPQAAFEAAQKHCQSLRKISSHHEHQSPVAPAIRFYLIACD